MCIGVERFCLSLPPSKIKREDDIMAIKGKILYSYIIFIDNYL